MDIPSVSIIVVAYNAGLTLRRCLDSAVSQTLSDIQIVIVDDGSMDNTAEIAEEYAVKDRRIRVVRQANKGVAVARQTGLDAANGEYVIYLDADDWVEPDMYEKMYSKAKKTDADMVVCDFIVEYGNRSVRQRQHPSGIHTDDPLDHLLRYGMNSAMWNKMIKSKLLCGLVKFVPGMPTIEDFMIEYEDKKIHQSQHPESLHSDDPLSDLLMFKFNSGPCNKLVRHACYKANNVKFKKGMVCNEDFYVLCQLFVNGLSKVEFIPEPLYHYDKSSNPNSISKSVSMDHLSSMLFCINYLEANVDVNKYRDGINTRKKSIKRWIWNSNGFSKRLTVDTFEEVNILFANEKGRFGQHSDIYYGLNGYYWLGRAMQVIRRIRNKN